MGRSCYHHGPHSNRKSRIPSGNSPAVVSGRFLAASVSVRRVRRYEATEGLRRDYGGERQGLGWAPQRRKQPFRGNRAAQTRTSGISSGESLGVCSILPCPRTYGREAGNAEGGMPRGLLILIRVAGDYGISSNTKAP